MVILRVKNRVANWADYLTLTEAGIVAKIGVNSHGLAIGLNILRGKKDQSAPGIPVHVFQRMALDNVSVDNVVKFARSLRFCCSSNAVLGDATGRVVSLEYGPDGVAVIEPDQDVLAHTNHFCDAQLAQFQAPLDPTLTTEARLDRANQHLTGWPDRVTTRNLTTFLRDDTGHAGAGHAGAICRTPDRSLPPAMQIESVCGVILNCNAREMLVAPGLPTAVEFESVAL
jgi:isopenicillin-N N-acyltransferase like protein